ncbi:MAG TPA: hypothetical protein VEG31_00575 [Thermoproteota archaeon]|nr:hypothetical protein [Thermoproteota archaeon]
MAYYGLVIVAMLFVFTQPALQSSLIQLIRLSLNQTLPSVVKAYDNKDFLLAVALTFLFNLAMGAFVVITLPNFVVPYWGVVIGMFRAVTWGLLLAPSQSALAVAMIPHSLTVILEGQGYIIAIFASYLQWQAVLKPDSVGAASRWSAYKISLMRTIRLYFLVALVLAMAAIYESFEVIYMVPLLIH